MLLPRRFSSCFRGYSDSLKVAQENWRCCRGAQMDDAKNDSTIADTSHGVSRCGSIHQLFGRALFPSFLAEFLRLQTKSVKTLGCGTNASRTSLGSAIGTLKGWCWRPENLTLMFPNLRNFRPQSWESHGKYRSLKWCWSKITRSFYHHNRMNSRNEIMNQITSLPFDWLLLPVHWRRGHRRTYGRGTSVDRPSRESDRLISRCTRL